MMNDLHKSVRAKGLSPLQAKIISVPRIILFGAMLGMAACGSPEKQEPKETKPESAFVNVYNSVPYTGSKVCRSCHADIFDSYMRTGMGRSLYEPFEDNIVEDFTNNNTVFDEKSGYSYRMVEKDGSYYVEEFRLDEDGNQTHSLSRKIRYVVGSGNSVRSYITEMNGLTFEMPVSWYSLKKIWDLSPGYHKRNHRFSRLIVQECIGCHNAYVKFQKGSVNKFEYPFDEGIGCERCHGPGAEHVKVRMKEEERGDVKSGAMDSTIVNPARLDRQRGLDVCQQCHLPGEMQVHKAGKDDYDFRPGMLLSEIKSIFDAKGVEEDGFGIASHPERLQLSACFTASGTMACATCHNPHVPVAETPVQHFNDRCQKCHAVNKLTVSPTHRKGDDCVSCHMKQGGTADIPHVNFTDHWIRRTLPAATKEYVPAMFSERGALESDSTVVELFDFFKEEDPKAGLRLGIAYYKYYYNIRPWDVYLQKAITLLEQAVADHPRSADAHFYLGTAYVADKNLPKARRQLETALTLDPTYIKANFWLGHVYHHTGKYAQAIQYYEKEMAIMPDDVNLYQNTANCYYHLGKLKKAEKYYRKAIEFYPDFPDAWENLGVLYYTRLNEFDKALKAYQQAVKLNPVSVDVRFNLGNVYAAKKQPEEAAASYKQALAIDPNHLGANANLGYLYLSRDEKKAARPYLQKTVQLNPSDQNAKKALKMTE